MTVWKHVDFEVADFGELAAGPQACSSYRDAVLALNPLAYWRLGETSGVTATDQSGHARHAAYLPGITLGAAGLLGYDGDRCADFAGSSTVGGDHVTTPLGDAFLNGDWSILGIINSDTTAQRRDILGTETGIASAKGVLLAFTTGSALALSVNTTGSAFGALILAAGTQVGVTYRFALTYSISSGEVRGYLNGAPTETITAAGGFGTGKPFTIGEVYAAGASSSASRNRRWDGRIDEIAAFDAVLSAEQILALDHLAAGVLHTP